jgi:hypothetical protein
MSDYHNDINTLAHRPMPVTLVGARRIGKGALLWSVDVQVGALLIKGCSVLRNSRGEPWVALPARQQIGSDDKVVRNAAGKAQYASIMEWTNKDTAARFGEAVLAAITAAHGLEALQPGSAA